jgi:hypothetical protein
MNSTSYHTYLPQDDYDIILEVIKRGPQEWTIDSPSKPIEVPTEDDPVEDPAEEEDPSSDNSDG